MVKFVNTGKKKRSYLHLAVFFGGYIEGINEGKIPYCRFAVVGGKPYTINWGLPNRAPPLKISDLVL
jgi:hypothetical protein